MEGRLGRADDHQPSMLIDIADRAVRFGGDVTGKLCMIDAVESRFRSRQRSVDISQAGVAGVTRLRSEEHTSELQSH